MKHRPSIHRATRKSLTEHHANFSLEGLKFHFGKLNQYTNPTGGGLDKIPLNTKAYTAAYYEQFKTYPAPPSFVPDPLHEPQPAKPFFLRKKAQYQVADHLLGIGQIAYWTGSTKTSTLLGLDIDDHESQSDDLVQANSQQALQLFVEMTGLHPVPCKSPGGINAFLICHKTGMTTEFTNESWHAVVRIVNAEARRRGLVAKLECKGKARIFTEKVQYCGVQFKDPLYATNPTDEQLHAFWDELEAKPVTGIQLHGLLTTLENEKYCAEATAAASSTISITTDDDLLPVYKGSWARQCREWAINGLPCDDSIFTVTSELAKWLYFVELPESDDRVQQVADLLFEFCKLKHNGYITRLNRGQEDDVRSHIQRIVESTVSRTSASGKAIFAKLQSQPHMKLVPLMQTLSPSAPFSPVKSTECCTVSSWLPAPEYRRRRAESWDYVPDDTPLPEALKEAISRYYQRNGLTIRKPTMVKLQRFLNHLWASPGHEARLGVETLRQKMDFGNDARKHIARLEDMGVIDSQGYCAVAGVSKLYRLKERAIEMFTDDGH
jgi:hypothetical protein